jgi:hypothetical protein
MAALPLHGPCVRSSGSLEWPSQEPTAGFRLCLSLPINCHLIAFRATNMFLPHRAPLTRMSPKATRLGNARIHGMTEVRKPLLAYITMQVGSPVLYLSHSSRSCRVGSLCIVLVEHIFSDRHGHQFRNILYKYPWPP